MTRRMQVTDVHILELLPQFMRDDPAVIVFANAMDQLFKDEKGWVKSLSGWGDLAGATDEELDELAWELNIPWYESGASKTTKAALIRHAEEVFSKLGTKQALESILQDYFGDVRVMEWMDYGGEPHHFKIISGNPDLAGTKFEQFLWLLSIAKRESSRLDSIDSSHGVSTKPLYAGVYQHDVTSQKVAIGLPFIPQYAGMFVYELTKETTIFR